MIAVIFSSRRDLEYLKETLLACEEEFEILEKDLDWYVSDSLDQIKNSLAIMETIDEIEKE